MSMSGGTVTASGLSIEVIEELLPLGATTIALANMPPIFRVTLEPQGREISFAQQDGRLQLELDGFTCHQMVVLHMK